MSRLFTALFGCYLFLVIAFGGSEKEPPKDQAQCEVYDDKRDRDLGVVSHPSDSLQKVVKDHVGLEIEDASGCIQDSLNTHVDPSSIYRISSPGK